MHGLQKKIAFKNHVLGMKKLHFQNVIWQKSMVSMGGSNDRPRAHPQIFFKNYLIEIYIYIK
jgi:hypothetical protein